MDIGHSDLSRLLKPSVFFRGSQTCVTVTQLVSLSTASVALRQEEDMFLCHRTKYSLHLKGKHMFLKCTVILGRLSH